MKAINIIARSAAAVCFAFVMSSASCDLFDSVDDVNFDIVLSQNFEIDEQANSDTQVSYSEYQVLDAAAVNTDFAKYKDKIKAITIKEVYYEISGYQSSKGTVLFKDGNIGFSTTTASAPTSLASLAVEDIQAAQGTEKTLSFNQSALNTLADNLLNDQQVKVFLTGALSQTPVKFEVEVKVKATITADAL